MPRTARYEVGAVRVTLSTDGGSTWTDGDEDDEVPFVYFDPTSPPTVTSVTPTSARSTGGILPTLSGSNFVPATARARADAAEATDAADDRRVPATGGDKSGDKSGGGRGGGGARCVFYSDGREAGASAATYVSFERAPAPLARRRHLDDRCDPCL